MTGPVTTQVDSEDTEMVSNIFLALVVQLVVTAIFLLLGWIATAIRPPNDQPTLREVWSLFGATASLAVLVTVVVSAVEVYGKENRVYALLSKNPASITPQPDPSPTLAYVPDALVTVPPRATPTPEPTPTPVLSTPTETPIATPTFTDTPTPNPIDTPLPTPTPTSTPTPIPVVEMKWRDTACDKPGQQASIVRVEVQGNFLVIYGVANHPAFDRYTLYFGTGEDLNKPVESRRGYDYVNPVLELGELHRMSLSDLKRGEYLVTLRVVRRDANYDTCEVGIIRR